MARAVSEARVRAEEPSGAAVRAVAAAGEEGCRVAAWTVATAASEAEKVGVGVGPAAAVRVVANAALRHS